MNGPMTQSPPSDSLFALARATDPSTSRLAADRMNASGAACDHAATVYAALCAAPHSTYRELVVGCDGLDATEVMRRLNTLEKKWLARKTGTRKCRVCGNTCSTWEAM